MSCYAFAISTQKEELNLYNLELEDLKSYTPFKTDKFLGKESLWILFQPNCSSCKKQLNDLDCLSKDTPIIALGVNAGRKKLNKALRPVKKRASLLSLKASPALKTYLNTVVTPSLLFVNNKGELKKLINGRKSCKSLKINLASLKDKL